MPKMVLIHHKDGREYAVTPADFRRAKVVEKDGEYVTYEAAGFKVDRWESGEPYEDSKAEKAP